MSKNNLAGRKTLIQVLDKHPNQKLSRLQLKEECFKLNPRVKMSSYDRTISVMSERGNPFPLRRIGRGFFVYEPSSSSLHNFFEDVTPDSAIGGITINIGTVVFNK